MSEQQSKTRWHLILGTMLKHLLTPVGITVELEVQVTQEPLTADILLLRRETADWTCEQKALLPDGIRDTSASHILLEFKYTESFSEYALRQTACYQLYYEKLHADELKSEQLQCFILSSKTPRTETLQEFDYQPTNKAGVFSSKTDRLAKHIPLISLNDLSDDEHNAWIRCFASKKKEQKKAFLILRHKGLQTISNPLYSLLRGLYRILFGRPKVNVEELMPDAETLEEMGKIFGKSLLESMTVEERLEGLSKEELLNSATLETLLSELKPEDRLKGLTPKDRLEGLAPKDRLEGLTPEEFLKGLNPEDVESLRILLKKIKPTLH